MTTPAPATWAEALDAITNGVEGPAPGRRPGPAGPRPGTQPPPAPKQASHTGHRAQPGELHDLIHLLASLYTTEPDTP